MNSSASPQEILAELEALSTVLAQADEDDRESYEKAISLLPRLLGLLKPPPAVVKKEAQALSRAAGKFLRGRRGGFKELSGALDRLIIALQKAPAVAASQAEGENEDAARGGDTTTSRLDLLQQKELEELCMDIDVLAGLVEDLQPSFVPGMLNILERNLGRPSLPRTMEERLSSVRDHLLRFEAGEEDAGETIAELLRLAREDLASFGGPDNEGNEAVPGGEETPLERELERLDELEAFLLCEEGKEKSDLSPALRYLEELAGGAETLALGPFSGLLSETRRVLSALPANHELIDHLLALKDLLQRHLRSLLDGERGEGCLEEIREILEDIVSHGGSPAGGKCSREETVLEEDHEDFELQEGIEANEEELADFIAEAPEDIQRVETALLELEKNPTSREWLNEAFRGFHNLKGSAGFLNLKDMVNVAHAAENLLAEAREGKIELIGTYADLALESLDLLKEMLRRVEGFKRGRGYRSPENYPRVLKNLLSWKRPEAGHSGTSGEEKTVPAPTSRAEAPGSEEVKGEPAPGEKGRAILGGTSPPQVSREHFIKVSTRRLDGLIDVVGELVIAHSMVAQEEELRFTKNPRLAKNLSQLSKIVRELQELAMSLRMVSLKSTFQKMARAARDLSVRSGIAVEFTYSGEDTEIDRNVVEEIANPLVHMIRNAIDHGIEPPEERRALGKPEAGRLHLRGYHQGGSVIVELEDDGRGIDHEKVLAKARSLGLVREGEEPSREEVLQFIFREGFSTADKVTDISGRGVGMDVVRRTVEALRGRVEVHSVPGRGTRIALRLPLTLAIIDGMVTRVAEENYILPSIAILESFRPGPGQVKTVSGRGEVILSRGELIPLFRLHRLFALRGAVEDPYRALILVLGENGKKCGLLVDDIEGQQQVVIKPLGEGLPRLPGVAGGAIMGSGRVALILDPQELLALAARR
ncbi:MAG: chemotaxis protein CheW [Actinobacteria bacterium]|nr:chemotaxis protein CheW [Actinomycetota bacterium]